MEGNIEGNEDGAGGSGIQKAGKVERKRFAGQKKVYKHTILKNE